MSLGACQTDKVVSVEDARKIQAQFSGQARFVPPPRNITDITAILDQYQPDPAQLEKMRAQADAGPPQGANPEQLAAFYYARGQAAALIDRRAQALADAREAARLAAQQRLSYTSRILQFLSIAEFSIGNRRNGVELARQFAETSRSTGTLGSQVIGSGFYSMSLARAGDVTAARRELSDTRSLMLTPPFFTSPSLRASSFYFDRIVAMAEMAIAEAEGNYAASERAARTALEISIFARSSPEAREISQQSGVQADIADRSVISGHSQLAAIFTSTDRGVEAEIEARKALIESLKAFGRYSDATASSVLLLARTIYDQGRSAEAATLVDIAIDAFQRLGAGKGSVALVQALMLKADILANGGDPAGALADVRAAADLLAGDDAMKVQHVSGNPTYGSVLLANGDAAAVDAFGQLLSFRRERYGERNYLTAEARGFLGVALARRGDRDRALGEFREAIPLLLQISRQADDGNGAADRDRRLQRILEGYIDLLSTMPRGGSPDFDPAIEAFRIADAARARGVQRALAASAARAAIRDPDLAGLVRQEQDARQQIAAQFGLLNQILSGPPDQQDASVTKSLRTQIDTLRGARAALRQEIERRFPEYANLIDPRPSSVAEVQAMLRPGEVLLSVYVATERTYVWGVPARGAVTFAAADMGERRIATVVAELRRALDPKAETLGDIPAFDVALAHRLYRDLVQPAAPALAGADSLLLVPDKALGQLPFGLLVTQATAESGDGSGALFSGYKKVPFLIRKYAVTQLPSVTALATLRRVPAAAANRKPFIGFGDPWFSVEQAKEAQAGIQVAALSTRGLPVRGAPLKRRSVPATAAVNSAELALLPRLPDTADEVRSIAAALNADFQLDVYIGARANEQRVRTMNLADRKVVAFATHGLIPGDLNGLTQPALALSAPSVAQVEGDGLLTMDEILGLRLDADWVVLSACNTAAGEGAGAEAASGLGRAFFYAGTRAVLVTNWPVETNSARMLTTSLFRRDAEVKGLGRAKAMQQSMIALIDGDGYVEDGKTVFSYAHPIFWGPFSLVGDGGSLAGGS